MNDEKFMIQRLQENLSTLRKIGGWTTQDLGEKIGVTKQTISNLENKKSTMTKLQYIGLRSVLDREATFDTANAKLLKEAMDILLDAELSSEEQGHYEEKMKLAAAAISGGATVSSVAKNVVTSETIAVANGPALGVISGVSLAAGTVGWLNKLMNKK